MSQPFQADVQVRTIQPPQARAAMQSPVQMRRGDVQSVTLTIPLLSDRNSYLVVRLPEGAVREMMGQARTLPPEQRAGYIRDWVMRNQQAVLEQHIRTGGGRSRQFRYNVVPVQAAAPRVGEATPRRVEQPQPPVAAAVPRREEQPAAPRPAQPQPAAPAARRTVDLSPAGPAPTERPVAPRARVELPPFPEQIYGGSGTRAAPYSVYMSRADFERRSRRETIIDWPLTLSVEAFGDVSFRVFLTESQASSGNRNGTRDELWTVFQGTLRRVAAERPGSRLDNTALRDARRAFTRAFGQAMAQYDRASEE